jgi:DNA-binding CsgD family transcriptional regulator
VALGKSNTDIGTILQISPHTVGTYLKRILRKLAVSSRTTAAVRAAQLGLLPNV